MVLRAYAKLNLYLKVLKKRGDNYHNIETIFERINLFDTVLVNKRRDKKINLVASRAGLPQNPAKNIAYKSAELLQKKFKINYGADIKIIKRIPIAAGLGGGSSDAAVVLLALNKLWGLHLTKENLASLAKNIGADVPFFIYNCPFAYAQAKGDKIKPLTDCKKTKLWHILIIPNKRVITAMVYKQWDCARLKLTPRLRSGSMVSVPRLRSGLVLSLSKDEVEPLTRPKYDVKILHLALRKRDPGLLGKALFNSLEPVTLSLYPEVGVIRNELSRIGVKSILMSGSGPAVFGVLSSKKEGLALLRQLRARMKKRKKSWQVFLVRTH
ncbi:MAG: 4-(cytidine 5'-diphospho)-2-C-methyl-D-erythritol kinase [Omnitrophica WOR_2 bacterium RBG_13_41_10]|nr:MAG: 4-(cytidine 5'-diphospho)-2-C-methyl-D-erythritol kinase [Omnitrophica WOR_2 bacterium RBG_13_41_10]